MNRNKTIALSLACAQIALLISYLCAVLLKAEALGNIISPLCGFCASFILFFSYRNTERSKKADFTLLIYSAACFAWGVADTMWAAAFFQGRDPQSDALIMLVYVLPNFLLLSALLAVAFAYSDKWHLGQFLFDLAAITIATVYFAWIALAGKDWAMLARLLSSDYSSVFSLISDIMIIIMSLTILLTRRSGPVALFLRILSAGILLFALTDIYYYYLLYNNAYNPNSINDFLYILALSLIAFGPVAEILDKSSGAQEMTFSNLGNKNTWKSLAFFPLAALVLCAVSETGVLCLWDIAVFVLIVLIHSALSRYLQLSLEYHKLLEREKEINESLEKRVEEQVRELTYLANMDTLTALYNRSYFLNALKQAIESKRPNELLAIALIDMDRFKAINDLYGHDVGDRVLTELAHRMIEWNDCGALLARLGGDEFAVLFQGKYARRDIEEFCQQIIHIFGKPIKCGGLTLKVSISVGISLHSENAGDASTLLKHADIAMYMAKSQGYNKYQFYNAMTCESVNSQYEIEALLKRTDIEKELEVFFQPQFSLPDIKLVGAEALVRWNNPEYGYISPGKFIPVAEETDCINKIGSWVMSKAILQAYEWNKNGRRLKISFNISPKQLGDDSFAAAIKSLLGNKAAVAEWLETEITESFMLGDEFKAYAVLELIKKAGMTISIDDFGSGYSSLSYLGKYPFDKIKIDKTLIDNLSAYGGTGLSIIKAIITMAKAAGIVTVAEGVETQEQLELLAELGCDQVQGYLLGRPVPAEVFEERFLCG